MDGPSSRVSINDLDEKSRRELMQQIEVENSKAK